MSPKKANPQRTINTGGGAYIEDGVHANGDFIGRDKNVYNAPVEANPHGSASRAMGAAVG